MPYPWSEGWPLCSVCGSGDPSATGSVGRHIYCGLNTAAAHAGRHVERWACLSGGAAPACAQTADSSATFLGDGWCRARLRDTRSVDFTQHSVQAHRGPSARDIGPRAARGRRP